MEVIERKRECWDQHAEFDWMAERARTLAACVDVESYLQPPPVELQERCIPTPLD